MRRIAEMGILPLLFFQTICVHTLTATCIFPKEMYISDTEQRYWRVLSRDPSISTYHKFRRLLFEVSDVFTEEYMATPTSDQPVLTKTYRCVKQSADNKYILEVEYPDGNKKYECVQFLIRHLNVVQWKISDHAAEDDDELCLDENLRLADSPLIYYYKSGYWRAPRNKDVTYEQFPLEGGYLMTWKDLVTGTNMMCSGDLPPLKLENECKQGEGLRFVVPFDTGTCSGAEAAMLNRQFLTLASWQEGNAMYSIVVEPQDEWKYILCIRTPLNPKDEFDAYVFMDSICDSTESLTSSNDIRKLHLNRYPVVQVCADETSSCGRYAKDPLSCDFPDAKVCRASCAVCDDDDDIGDPELNFHEDYQGTWLKNTNHLGLGEEEVLIDDRTISFESLGDYRLVTVANCDENIDESSGHDSTEYFVLSTFKNGCSPRLSRMVIANRSSSVISVRISQSKYAELSLDVDQNTEWVIKNNGWNKECQISYKGDIDPIYDTFRPYDNGWFNLVAEQRDEADSVPCQFPFNDTIRKFSMSTKQGANSTGEVQFSDDSTFFTLAIKSHDLTDTESSLFAQENLSGKNIKFTCIAQFPGDKTGNRNFLITTTSASGHNLVEFTEVCWIFLSNKQLAYWMPISDCDVNTEYHIEAKFKQPLAVLRFTSGASILSQIHLIQSLCLIFMLNALSLK